MEPITIGLWILGGLLGLGAGMYVWKTLKNNLSSFIRSVRWNEFGARAARMMRKAFALVRNAARTAQLIFGIVDASGVAWAVTESFISWLSVPSEVIEVINETGEYVYAEDV